MQRNSEVISDEIIDKLINHFNKKVRGFVVSDSTDTPYTMFKIEFIMYDFYNIVLTYDRGRFGCSIVNGNKFISIKNSQQWYDKADMKIFLDEFQQQIELRIPDKYLEANGLK